MSGHEDKGKRYISQLNAARIAGSWNELPELVRKVTKHAPSEKLLIQTATVEHYAASCVAQGQPKGNKEDDEHIKSLKAIVDAASNTRAEDIFQAHSCLLWAWCAHPLSETQEFISTADVLPVFDLYGQKATSPYTKIALLRAISLQATLHVNNGRPSEALACWKAATAWIELNLDMVKTTSQMAYWAECILASMSKASESGASVAERTKASMLWSSVTAKAPEVPKNRYGNPYTNHVSRAGVLKECYTLASSNIAHQPPSTLLKSQLVTQLRTSETHYETVFLRDTKFPKANESNAEVEAWVEQVIRNWQVLCGPTWSDADLGEGGRNAYTRNVLDILYRAATKTFHSLLILRRLFQVHKSLTEFDLAYHCLDTYVELAERARDRAAKDGHPAAESDELVLLTMAEGIEGLCSYGRQSEAQRAIDLAAKVEDWLPEVTSVADPVHTNGYGSNSDSDSESDLNISRSALQEIYRAIGIAKAQWARWTPFVDMRDELQVEAMSALRDAVHVHQPQLPTLYALSLLCAERREISQALKWTKLALQKISAQGAFHSPFESRSHCTFWHLLALLLSSQQDFETGRQSSAAALDAFLSTTLTTDDALDASTASSLSKLTDTTTRAVPDLECDDLQRVIQLQTTYLGFVELLDGPETALNQSGELLSTYAALFKRFEIGDVKQVTEQNLAPPKTSAGTIKSSRGSIFSRRKHAPSVKPSVGPSSPKSSTTGGTDARPTTQASQAPTIQVTDEGGKPREKKHHTLLHKHRHQDHKKTSHKQGEPAVVVSDQEKPNSVPEGSNAQDHATVEQEKHDASAAAKQPLDNVVHNVTSHDQVPPPLSHDEQPPEQDVRPPMISPTTTSTSPIPRFPISQAQKHALVVLHKVWLSTALLYQRSHMFDDAFEAIDEAVKAAQRIEQIVASIDSSAKALATAGWGSGKMSSDEVWADTFCARAELLHAVASKRAEEGMPITGESLREVVEQYEQCLMYAPNHAKGIIGLSNILLDFYEKKIDLAKKVDGGQSFGIITVKREEPILIGATTPATMDISDPLLAQQPHSNDDLKKSPENLNRIAARDRAYGLLDTLTKSGHGWDNSEAWFALARAHELGAEFDKAKKILWWCIELEDTKPIRHWNSIATNGYVL